MYIVIFSIEYSDANPQESIVKVLSSRRVVYHHHYTWNQKEISVYYLCLVIGDCNASLVTIKIGEA